MAAKIKPRSEVDYREKLEDVIPLSTPFTLYIDPSSGCNFQCTFCPTGDRNLIKQVNRKVTQMSFELFKKIIDDLDSFDGVIKLLRLHKEGEPLLNKDFTKMVKYAKQSKKILKIDTTTNASLLNPKKNLEIIEAGLDRINISIEGLTQKQYLDIAKYKINFDELVDNIKHFYENKGNCEVSVKIPGDWLSQEQKKEFISIFSPIADRIFIENISNCWPDYEMNGIKINENIGVYGHEKKDIDICPYIFYSMAINSDGTVSACCVDWERKLILGDTKEEKVKDIWLGKKLNKLQILHLNKKRKNYSICSKCHLAQSCAGDDIDDFASDILKRLENCD